MFDFLKGARARRSAVRAIAPMVDYSRLRIGEIPPAAWRRPYIVGFVTMLASLVVHRETDSRLGATTFGNAQVRAWLEITGLPEDGIADEICLLSASADADFVEGCRNAGLFIGVYDGRTGLSTPELSALWDTGELDRAGPGWLSGEDASRFGNGGAAAATLWIMMFESRLT